MPEQETQNPDLPEKELLKEVETSDEKEFLGELKKRHKSFLIDNLSILERERIAKYICSRIRQELIKHNELEKKIDEYDEVYRMQRKEVPGSDGDLPNYRTPLTTVTLEVVHSHMMNVFFTPKDLVRALPTEEGDVPKVKKLGIFANWSAENELKAFENIDRLFHNSEKVGECPYIVHWVKEYGVDIEQEPVPDPTNPEMPLIDKLTNQPVMQEKEKVKLLYNGPRLEVFSRKDYLQPENSMMDRTPDWEAVRIRMSFDEYLREEESGKMYSESIDDIKDWGSSKVDTGSGTIDFDGQLIPLAEYDKCFWQWYGRLRIKTIKTDKEKDFEEIKELEDEFIAIVNIEDEVLCQLRTNTFPLKMRPVGVDYFIPDDEGRRKGIGGVEFMDGPQKAYDALFNQYIEGTVQANQPIVFEDVFTNMKDGERKLKRGRVYKTANAAGIKILQFPSPDQSIQLVMELVQFWAQMLFGISEFTAGLESKIDPNAPAKKAEIVVQQGSVRLNMIIKRKLRTLKDIFKRWFLLYKANMPPNKFMRIVGYSQESPFKFESVTLSDFALKSIPDFEITGNILNVNKSFEANKAIAIYNLLIQNPFFTPQTIQGLQALHSLTKWLIDKLDELGLSKFLPEAPGDIVRTPEEENARFLQGDEGTPLPNEDHINHIRVHREFLLDPSIPDEIKQLIADHINKHVEMIKQMITKQMVLGEANQINQGIQQQGGGNERFGQQQPGQAGEFAGTFQGQPASIG